MSTHIQAQTYPTVTHINNIIAAGNRHVKINAYTKARLNIADELKDIRTSILESMRHVNHIIKMTDFGRERNSSSGCVQINDLGCKLQQPRIFIDFIAEIVDSIQVTIYCDTEVNNIVVQKNGSTGLSYPTTTLGYSTEDFDPNYIANCIAEAVNSIRTGILEYHNLKA